MRGDSSPAFRSIRFTNGCVMFMRPKDHEERIIDLVWQVRQRRVTVENMSMEEAAAWSSAVALYHATPWGQA